MQHVFETEAACSECKATGLYVGMAERNGFAVVCHRCKGTGKRTLKLKWDDFDGLQPREDVQRVVEYNPGICLGVDAEQGLYFDSFGGLSYEDWTAGTEFGPRSEMRAYTCPAWWYQSADYKRKPDWDECLGAGAFSGCAHFGQKARCWARFDREQGQ